MSEPIDQDKNRLLRQKIIGLGERSISKSYYPELRIRLEQLEMQKKDLEEERRKARESEANYRSVIENIQDVFYRSDDRGDLIMASPSFLTLLGYESLDECLGKSIAKSFYYYPDKSAEILMQIQEKGSVTDFEVVLKRRDGTPINVETSSHFYNNSAGAVAGIEGIFRDITGRKKAEEDRLAHLRFLENLDRINRAIQGTDDMERMMSDVLETMLSIFDCDRSWLLYPCDPDAPSFRVPMEITKPEYPGAKVLNMDVPMTPGEARNMREALESDAPVTYTAGTERPVSTAKQFGVQSQMFVPIYTNLGKPWVFGMHQCSYPRIWTQEEKRLFQEISRRMAPALASLLVLQELRESENRYRRITEGLTDYQYTVRIENGRAAETTQNPACATVTGYTPEEFAADPYLWINIVVPDDRKLVRERVQQVLAGMDIPPLEHRILHKDGEVRWVRDTIILMKDASGQILSYDGVIKDITMQKRAEEDLRASEGRLKAIVDGSPIPQFVIGRDHRITHWNHALEEYSGLMAEDMIGTTRHWRAFYDTERPCMADLVVDGSDDLLPRLYAGKYRKSQLIDNAYETVDFFPAMKGGTWMHFTAAPIKDPDGVIIGAVETLNNITEQKRIEEALEKRLMALTRPLDNTSGIEFEELFNLKDIQRLQDEFARATGVASIITHPDGSPITEPSNFCRLCNDIIRKTDKGRINCYRSDAELGRFSAQGPAIQPCMSGGLWDAGAGISVGGRHIANWLIGQVRDETQSEEKIRAYAGEIGADESETVAAFHEVTAMSQEQFQQIAQALYTLANQLSAIAYQNIQQARFITEHKQAEKALMLNAERLDTLLKINQMVDDPLQEIMVYAFEEAIRLTRSEIGYLGLMNDDETEMEVKVWSSNVMPECRTSDSPNIFPIKHAGLWGEVVRQRRPIITNDYNVPNPLKKGYPEGHITLKRHMNIPVMVESKIMMIAGVGNKAEEYDKTDVQQLTLLMEGVWRLIERKQAEETLRRSESNYRSVIENIQDVFYRSDARGNLTMASPSFLTLLGYTSFDECLGKPISGTFYFYPDKRAELLNHIKERGSIADYEVILKRKDGMPVTVETNSHYYYDDAGNIAGVEGIFRDITDRKRAEKALQASERQMKAIVDGSPIPQFVIDRDHRIIHWNRALEEYSGLGAEEMIGTSGQWRAFYGNERPCMADLIVDGSVDLMSQWFAGKYRRSQLIENAYEATDFFLNMKGGIWLYFTAAPIFDAAGSIIGAVETLTDITERMRVEKALEASHHQLRQHSLFLDALLAAMPIPVFYKDTEGRYLGCNSIYSDIMGVPKQDFIGKTVFDLWPGELAEEYHRRDMELLHNPGIQAYEFQVKNNSGEIRDVVFRKSVFRNEDGSTGGIIGGLFDITERKQAEESLRNSLAEKDVILRELYHRTKNNMQVISSMLNLKVRDIKDAAAQDVFSDIQTKIQTMALVHQKLYESKDLSNINLNDYISSIVNLIMKNNVLTPDKLKIHQSVDTIPTSIDTAMPLGLVLNELISNSIKHAFPGDRAGEIWIEMHAISGGFKLEYRDNGIGLPRSFDPATATTLGMIIIQNLSKMQLGGDIRFVNKNGFGCVIQIKTNLYRKRI